MKKALYEHLIFVQFKTGCAHPSSQQFKWQASMYRNSKWKAS